MANKFLRIKKVLEIVPWGKSTIYEKIAGGKFPQPVKLDDEGRAVGWLESEIDAWIEERVAARDADAGGADSETDTNGAGCKTDTTGAGREADAVGAGRETDSARAGREAA